MKTPNTFQSRHPQRGVALVIVLAMLLLLSALLVAFMSSVSTERLSARAAAATFEARQAYESAVNLVMSQIREATLNDDGTQSWSSQPGLLRTFDNNDKDRKVIKLYSSDKMIVDAADYDPTSPSESGIVSSDLLKTLDGFVDLNASLKIPVDGDRTGAVRAVYPIVDPMAALDYSGSAKGADPTAPGRESINGFYCTKIEEKDKTTKDSFGRVVRAIPMRVKWLYQLKDGTLSAADATGKIPKATKKNPPVARFAFWTDDETCKINLNTAAEYTYWDTPMASTSQESGKVDGTGQIDPGFLANSLELAASQPAFGEHQRFSGHPATVSLSPAIRWLFQPAINPALGYAPGDPRDKQYKEQLFKLLPRYSGGYGTSLSGTKNAWIIYFDPISGVKNSTPDPRITKRDRLFATIDEFWFRPDRSPLTSNGLYSVFVPEGAALPYTSATQMNMTESLFSKTPASTIDRLRLFLTTVSRAPDLNLAGKPRIVIWPIPEDKSRRSAYDDVALFCGTIAGQTYAFERAKSWSPTYDFELANHGRNKQLFEYLQSLTSTALPGTNKSFSSKYGADRDQILIEIFDYIRCTNLVDTGNKNGANLGLSTMSSYPNSYTPSYDYLKEGDPNKFTGDTKPFPGSGQVIATIRRGDGTVNRGNGRFLTLSELCLCFFRDTPPRPTANVPDDIPIAGFDDDPQTAQTNAPVRNSEIPIRCVLLPEMFSVSPGYPAMSESYAYTITELQPFQFIREDGSPYDFKVARGDANYVEVDSWRSTDGRFFMPTRGFPNQFQYDALPKGARTPKTFTGASGNGSETVDNPLSRADYSRYPFMSRRFYVRPNANGAAPTQFKFKGGKFRLDFYSLDITDAQAPGYHRPYAPGIIQSVTVEFPSGITTVPVPTKAAEILYKDIPARMLAQPGDGSWLQYTMRSMEINGAVRADTRLANALYEVPPSYFSPAGSAAEYASFTQQVHNLRSSWGQRYAGVNARYGFVTPTLISRPDKIIDIAQSIRGIPSLSGAAVGDFDRGMSKHTDGPFINKADEGNMRMKLDDDPNGGGSLPYYRGAQGYDEVGSNFFSPNRIISSPVMFGSLSTGVMASPPRPWETLLFSPPVGPTHRGAQTPADHFLLDLFNMPVVEPYAISEPLSTTGRINLNHRFAPWGYVKIGGKSYLERTTALYGVFKDMKILAIPSGTPDLAHNESPLVNATNSLALRQDVDAYQTIELSINAYLNAKGYFRSASQICELDLLTKGTRYSPFTTPGPAGRAAFWNANQQTGDNARERPYSQIYPRLTTKSNTYTIHIWAQSIAKNPATKEGDWDKFNEDVDRVIGEYRGSTTIERYLDPNDPAIKNYDAAKPGSKGLDPYYRFRILNNRRFVAQ